MLNVNCKVLPGVRKTLAPDAVGVTIGAAALCPMPPSLAPKADPSLLVAFCAGDPVTVTEELLAGTRPRLGMFMLTNCTLAVPSAAFTSVTIASEPCVIVTPPALTVCVTIAEYSLPDASRSESIACPTFTSMVPAAGAPCANILPANANTNQKTAKEFGVDFH